MSEQWGRTGRVTLKSASRSTAAVRVHVTGEFVGHVAPYLFQEKAGLWFALPRLGGASRDLPSRDAAVAWLLRRAAPDAWRDERPIVYSVARAVYPKEVRWWAWEGRDFQKADAVVPIVVRTFHQAVQVADFNARSRAKALV